MHINSRLAEKLLNEERSLSLHYHPARHLSARTFTFAFTLRSVSVRIGRMQRSSLTSRDFNEKLSRAASNFATVDVPGADVWC